MGCLAIKRQTISLLLVVILLICLLWPFVELATDSNQGIFQTGEDAVASLAFLVISLASAVVITYLIFTLIPIRERSKLTSSPQASSFDVNVLLLFVAISPPANLRI